MEVTSAAPVPVSPMLWDRIEDKFRIWSFRIYYERSYATELDHTLRFAKALVASIQPIRDRHAVVQWYRQRLLEMRKRK